MDGFVRKRKKVGKPVMYIHPVTGEYRVPASDEQEMPLRYKMLGYERREFNSYHEHAAWCKSKGLVNHYIEGIGDDKDAQVSRWGY